MGNTEADIPAASQTPWDETLATVSANPDRATASTSEHSAGVVEPDSAISEMVRQGILKAREKLIDLSLRNGMLHYRLSETSSRHVRIIDARPEFLVKGLASGHSLNVVPIPPVDVVPRDEDTAEFRLL
jgi:hypothetical protein